MLGRQGETPGGSLLHALQLGHPLPQAQRAPIKNISWAPGHGTQGLVAMGAAALFFEEGLQGDPASNWKGVAGTRSRSLTCLIWWKQEMTAFTQCLFWALICHVGRPAPKTKGNGLARTWQICPGGGHPARLAHRCPARSLLTAVALYKLAEWH